MIVDCLIRPCRQETPLWAGVLPTVPTNSIETRILCCKRLQSQAVKEIAHANIQWSAGDGAAAGHGIRHAAQQHHFRFLVTSPSQTTYRIANAIIHRQQVTALRPGAGLGVLPNNTVEGAAAAKKRRRGGKRVRLRKFAQANRAGRCRAALSDHAPGCLKLQARMPED